MIWGIAGAGLMLVGCVAPYGERVAASPAGALPPPTAAPEPVVEAPPPPPEVEPKPEPEKAPEPTGIDVNWTYFVGKAADQQLAPLAGPEVEEQAGAWKCVISKQETTTEESQPVARERSILCKHWGDMQVGTSVTCDLDRHANEVTLTLADAVVVVACAAK